MVDAAILYETFARTLVPSGDVSRQAEKQLMELETQPEFIIGLLQVVSEPQVDIPIRRASAIYLKNQINRCWSPNSVYVLSDSDKALFKQQLLPAIVNAPLNLRSLLVVCLSTVLNVDYQKNMWPEFLNELKVILDNTSDLSKVAGGLSIFKQLCKFYRWNLSSVSQQLSPILTDFYPHLLQIAEAAVSAIQKESSTASSEQIDIYYQLIYDVFKIYKLSTARYLPEIVRRDDIAQRTMALFLQVLVLPLPEKVMQIVPAVERKNTLPVKCQKWATANITKTYNSYLTPSYTQLSDNGKAYEPFRVLFDNVFAPEITRIFLEQLKTWSSGSIWLSNAALYNIVLFLECMITLKSVFENVIKPQVPGILQSVIFPLVCPADEELELFETDPSEFMQLQFDAESDTNKPGNAAAYFIEKLLRKKESCMNDVAEFLQTLLSNIQEAQDNVKGLVGVFRFAQRAELLFKSRRSPFYQQLEPFMVQCVFPNLRSTHSFIRYEACCLIQNMPYTVFNSRERVIELFQSVMLCFFDKEHLPVQVAGALTLDALSEEPHNEDIRAAIGEHITEIIAQLLNVTQQIDCEPLLTVLDHFVDQFPDKIGPFAVGLATQLCQQFIALASDLIEQTNALDDNSIEAENKFLQENDEKITTGLGIMNSLANLQSQLEKKPELTNKLDEVMAPLFVIVYQSNFLEFVHDCFNLHENSLFTLKSVPERHWQYFDTLLGFIQRTGYDYFEEVMPVFESYIAYGSKTLAADANRLSNFVQLLISLFSPANSQVGDDSLLFSDARTRAHVMSLLGCLFVSQDLFNGPLDPYLKITVETVLSCVSADAKSKAQFPPRYNVSTVSLILSCLYYNPKETMTVLSANNAVDAFLETWFQTLNEFTRVNDLKLCVVASLSLLNYYVSNPDVQPAFALEIVHTLAHSLESLPGAVARANEILLADNEDLYDDGKADFFDEEEEFDDFDNDTHHNASEAFEQELPPDAARGESVFIHEQPGPKNNEQTEPSSEEKAALRSAFVSEMGFIADDFDADLYSISPLDELNPYDALRAVFNRMQNQSPDRYQSIIGNTPEKDKALLLDSMQIQNLPPIERFK